MSLPPGAELDALVAEKVLGVEPRTSWEILNEAGTGSALGFDREREAREYLTEKQARGLMLAYHVGPWKHWLPYSTDLTTCAAAAEEARKAGKIRRYRVEADWLGVSAWAEMPNGLQHSLHFGWHHGDVCTPAHALALALLKAVGHE